MSVVDLDTYTSQLLSAVVVPRPAAQIHAAEEGMAELGITARSWWVHAAHWAVHRELALQEARCSVLAQRKRPRNRDQRSAHEARSGRHSKRGRTMRRPPTDKSDGRQRDQV